MDSKMCFKTAPDFWLRSSSKGGGSLLLLGAVLWWNQKPPQRDSSWAIEWAEPGKAPLVFIPKQNPFVRLTCRGYLSNKMKDRNPSEVIGDFCIASNKKQKLFSGWELGRKWIPSGHSSFMHLLIIQASTLHWSTSQLFLISFSLHLDLVLEMCKKEIGSLYPRASFPICLSFV